MSDGVPLEPYNPDAYDLLAQIYEKLGEDAESIKVGFSFSYLFL